MGIWFLLGFAGEGARPRRRRRSPPTAAPLAGVDGCPRLGEPRRPPPPPPPRVPLGRQFLAQFGFLAPSIPREIGLGLLLGIGAWVAVLLALMVVAGVALAAGRRERRPQVAAGADPAHRRAAVLDAVPDQPLGRRGRGELLPRLPQPRIGILLSTGFFVLAHLSYGQPFMLVGIALLSLIYAFLVKWRQNLWPAMAAHALFDGVQLLVVVPAALRDAGSREGRGLPLVDSRARIAPMADEHRFHLAIGSRFENIELVQVVLKDRLQQLGMDEDTQHWVDAGHARGAGQRDQARQRAEPGEAGPRRPRASRTTSW